MVLYDICIVGAGLWGSSAARHASKPGRKVCLIGPTEPSQEDRRFCEIFASHYDAARAVRKYQGSHHLRSLMTMRTFKALTELEATAGIKLSGELGHIMFGNNIDSVAVPLAKTEGVLLTAEGVRERYPFLDVSQYGDSAMLFVANAGHANPRMIVRAQQQIAAHQGCDIIEDVVEAVQESLEPGQGEPLLQLLTKKGRRLSAKKVLLCTGAFTHLKNLLPPSKKLDLGIDGTFVVKLEVGESDLEKLRAMPTMTSFTDPEWNCYIIPPVRYPDGVFLIPTYPGKYYLKLGPGYQDQRRLNTLKEVKDWFLSQPDPKLVAKYRDLLLSIVKDFTPVSVQADMCVCTRTRTELPYCDMLSPRLGLAVGGYGYEAMLSDEVGRMAARMIAGEENWSQGIPEEALKARFIQTTCSL